MQFLAPRMSNSQDLAYSFIKNKILEFSFEPGRKLRAQDIAAHLDLSRTPVREALSRLEQEGLVVRDSGWGYLVKGMSLAEVASLFRVRELLEVEAAREALARLDDATIGVLTRILAVSERNLRAGRVPEFQKVNREFHATLARSTGNPFLENMLSAISDRIRILGSMVLQNRAVRGEEMLAENRAILAALEARDASAVEEAVRSHVKRAGEHVMRCLQDDPERLFCRAVA